MRTILLDAPHGPSLSTQLRPITGDALRHLVDFEGAESAIAAREVELIVDARTEGPPLRSEQSLPVIVCVRDDPSQVPTGSFFAPRDPQAVRAVVEVAATLARKRKQDLDGLSTPQRITHWLLNAAPVMIGVRQVKGSDFVHLLDNRLSAALWGKTPDELHGRSDRELGVAQEHIDSVMRSYEQARAENRAVDFEFDFSRPDRPRVMRGKLAPMELGNSKAEYLAFVAENVSEVRELQAQLLRADRLASLGSMAASIGHEIKEPASAVLLSLTNALDVIGESGRALPEDHRDEMEASLHAAIGGIRRISALVHDLQSLASSSETGVRPVQLRAVVDSVLALVGAELRGRAMLRHEYEEGPPVAGNAVKLAQVILNFLRRAHEGLDPSRAPDNRVTVRTRPDDDAVLVEVIDNGDPDLDAPEAVLGRCLGVIDEYGGSAGAERTEQGRNRRWFRLPAAG